MQYHTGCDAHKKFCTFHHTTSDGADGMHENIPTDSVQINRFLDRYDQPTTITLEAGRNWWHLYHLFKEHPMVSEVNVADPWRSRKVAEDLSPLYGYGRASNDDIDSEMLAEIRRRNLLLFNHIPSQEQMELRTFNRFRQDTIAERTHYKNKIHAILSFHGTDIPIRDLMERTDSFKASMERSPAYVQQIIEFLLNRISMIDQQIQTCESHLNRLLPEDHPQMKILASHPGIATVFARTILSEILDIAHFKEPKNLISFSGLAPVTGQSADRKKGKVMLNRHCNYYLKYAFTSAAHTACKYYKYRRKYELDCKTHGKMIAKFNLARRIIKNVHWMLTSQQYYKQ